MGSVHGPAACPYELWTGKKPDLLTLSMIVFGSVVMTPVPSKQQAVGSVKSILHYAVGTAVEHQGSLRLFNPKTKRDITRRTYKLLGTTPQTQTQPKFEIAENGDVTVTPVSADTPAASDNVDDYKYLVGTIYRDLEDMELYKTLEVMVETFDEEQGPMIVSHRRRVTDTGALLPKTEDDEYPYHLGDVVQYTT